MPTKTRDREDEYAKEEASVADVETTERQSLVCACQSLKNPSFPVDKIAVIGFPLYIMVASSTCVMALLWADFLNDPNSTL